MGYLVSICREGQSGLSHKKLPPKLTPAHRLLQSIQLTRLADPYRIHQKSCPHPAQNIPQNTIQPKYWLSSRTFCRQFDLCLFLVFDVLFQFGNIDGCLLRDDPRFWYSWCRWSLPQLPLRSLRNNLMIYVRSRTSQNSRIRSARSLGPNLCDRVRRPLLQNPFSWGCTLKQRHKTHHFGVIPEPLERKQDRSPLSSIFILENRPQSDQSLLPLEKPTLMLEEKLVILAAFQRKIFLNRYNIT